MITLLKYGTLMAITTIGFAIITKPTSESFDPYFKSFLKKGMMDEIKDNNIVTNVVTDGLAIAINLIKNKREEDVIVAKIVDIHFKEKKCSFIGAFGTWFGPLKN